MLHRLGLARPPSSKHRNENLELVFDPSMEYVRRMNWSKKPLGFALGGLLLAAAAWADVNRPGDNAYHVVVERNPFGLNPPKPVPIVTNTPPVQKSDVKFTGITVDRFGKKAWLVVPPPPNNRTQNPQYLSMREQETQGDIQVLEIDDKENTVKIVNAGTPVVLTFKENGYATPTAAAMPGNPLAPHNIPGALPTPGVLPTPGLPMPGIMPAPTTPGVKTAGVTPTGNPANDALAARYGLQNAASGVAPTIAPVRTIPTRTLRTPVEPQAQTTAAPADPVVQHILREAQKMQSEQQQGIAYPPLPPPPGAGK
jgi:hypothetical protein